MKTVATGVLALLVLVTVGVGLAPRSAAAPGTTDGTVAVTVLDVSPNTPGNASTQQKLTFSVELRNTSSVALQNLIITPRRGEPINSQQALQSAVNNPQPPGDDYGLVMSPSAPAITASLAPGESKTISVSTTSSMSPGAGLCICIDAIYPIYFSVESTGPDGSQVQVGSAQTYVPAFSPSPQQPVQVSWVWPLLERPHRLSADDVFIDDDLASSVAAGGRLYRLLQVAEQAAAANIPMTLVVDPELIDELAVMSSSTGYQVASSGSAPSAKGAGGAQAAAWLAGLRSVLAAPGMELALTPYANPDVQSLTQNGLPWATTMPTAMQTRVSGALGSHPADQELSWPTSGAISPLTAAQLTRDGVRTVLLNASSLRTDAVTTGPTVISTPTADLTAYATPAPIDSYLSSALSQGGLSTLPLLVSEVALQAVLSPTQSDQVVLIPPATVDPDPTAAFRAIQATTSTFWSQSAPLLASKQRIPATVHASLTASTSPLLPAQTVRTIRTALDTRPALNSMVRSTSTSAVFLDGLPEAIQRLESGQWIAAAAAQAAATQQVADGITQLTQGIRLVVPTNGSYTLGSNSSPLPITIDNTTGQWVQVRLQLSAVGGVPGFSAKDVGLQSVPPNSRLPLHVPIHIDRAGRIKVQVALTTPLPNASGQAQWLGDPLVLSVRSTALGDIGEIIMWAAGVILGLALLFRVTRRIRSRGGNGPTDAPQSKGPELQPIGGA